MSLQLQKAPELQISQWFNTENSITLEGLRSKVILIEAFQMLCPGCVSHSLPQAIKAAEMFKGEDFAVIGLHTVFEHHDAMTPVSLKAFLHEYRITFPVGVDVPSENAPTPKTMTAYQMRGTPSTILIDREGYLRKHSFGRLDDMALGAEIATLLREPANAPSDTTDLPPDTVSRCDDDGCPI